MLAWALKQIRDGRALSPRQRAGASGRGTLLVPAILSFGLTACGGNGGPGGDAGGPTVFGPEDVHVIGTSEAIALVEDLEVVGDTVWIQNSVEPLFIGFGLDGVVVGDFGVRGGGPEEFRMPAGFVSGGIGGEAWVLDARRHALIGISQRAQAWSEIPIPRDSLPPGSLISGRSLLRTQLRSARLGREIIVPRSIGSLEAGMFSFSRAIWGADLLAVDPVDGTARSVLSLSRTLGDPSALFSELDEAPPMLLWFRLWTVCGENQLRVYDRFRDEVRRFDGEGLESATTPLPAPAFTGVTAEQFARAIFAFREAEVTGQVGGQLTSADSTRLMSAIMRDVNWDPEEIALILPRYVDLRCADDGTLWLQPFDPDMGGLNGGKAWLRIPEGGVAGEVHFPERFDPYRFVNGRIWGVQRDELDVGSLAWIPDPGARSERE